MKYTDEQIFHNIKAELKRARKKFPKWPKDIIHASAIVQEEAGELVQASLQCTYEGNTKMAALCEAIQTAAMAFRFIEHFEEMSHIPGDQLNAQ